MILFKANVQINCLHCFLQKMTVSDRYMPRLSENTQRDESAWQNTLNGFRNWGDISISRGLPDRLPPAKKAHEPEPKSLLMICPFFE